MMNDNNPRQRVKQESQRILGKGNSLHFDTQEHSAFLNNGSIATKIDTDSPVVLGIVTHDPSKIVGQCQTCQNFTTASMHNICQNCSQVVCSICAKPFDQALVCPNCKEALKHRRWLLIVKKIFIDPFVERVG